MDYSIFEAFYCDFLSLPGIRILLFRCMRLLLMPFDVELHSLVELFSCKLLPCGIHFIAMYLLAVELDQLGLVSIDFCS